MNSKKGVKRDVHPIGHVCVMIIGLAFAVRAVSYGLGSLREPGPGFMPFLTGSMMALFSAIVLIKSLIRGWMPLRTLWEGAKWRRAVLAVATLFSFCYSLLFLGFLLTAFPVMVVLFRLSENPKWGPTILFASLTTACFYILFQVLLQSQLPTGFIGF